MMNAKKNEITHYGVVGMKWGVRRYQNPDGSLTSLGKSWYYGGGKDVNDILKTMTDSDRYLIGIDDPDDYASPKYVDNETMKRFIKRVGGVPVAFLDIEYSIGGNAPNVVIGTRNGDEYRNKGYASELAKEGVKWIDDHADEFNKYDTHVRWVAFNENEASKKTALKAGFEEVNKNETIVDPEFETEYRYEIKRNQNRQTHGDDKQLIVSRSQADEFTKEYVKNFKSFDGTGVERLSKKADEYLCERKLATEKACSDAINKNYNNLLNKARNANLDSDYRTDVEDFIKTEVLDKNKKYTKANAKYDKAIETQNYAYNLALNEATNQILSVVGDTLYKQNLIGGTNKRLSEKIYREIEDTKLFDNGVKPYIDNSYGIDYTDSYLTLIDKLTDDL